MSAPKTDLPGGWWLHNLDEVDREIARLATICEARILDRGVVERVLHDDASVCGRSNALAFASLRKLLMLHFAIRDKAADAVGQTETAEIELYVIDRLKKIYPELGTDWPPR